MAVVDLHPLPVTRNPARRLPQLLAGLALYGLSMAMQIRSGLGLNPWDVLHEGLTTQTGLSFGLITAVTGAVVLLLWIPLRQRPGIGTVANVVLVGLSLDGVLILIPVTGDLALRWVYLLAGIVVNGIATGAYIGAGLGPGPRDGLMVGFARGGRSLRVVRTAIEVSVLLVGWLLGGTVGIGTVLFALTIGPIVHRTVPAFSRANRPSADRGAPH
jgi:uncharacterized membrane protein YczE